VRRHLGPGLDELRLRRGGGRGLIVRDYFAQGFYPDGTNGNTNNNADKVSTISGALLKAALVASAQWMSPDGSNLPYGPNLTRTFRGNREQGFGRIQLTNVLPLQTYPGTVTVWSSVTAARLRQVSSITRGLDLTLDPAQTTTATINVCDTSQPLTVVIAWTDTNTGPGSMGSLGAISTSSSRARSHERKYLGNFFTDDVTSFRDNTDDNTITGNEECTYNNLPWPPNFISSAVDTGPWSLPVSGTGVSCTDQTVHADKFNNVEGIFLSPDSRLTESTTTRPRRSTKRRTTRSFKGSGTSPSKLPTRTRQPGLLDRVAGGICRGSSVKVQRVLPLNQLGGSSLTATTAWSSRSRKSMPWVTRHHRGEGRRPHEDRSHRRERQRSRHRDVDRGRFPTFLFGWQLPVRLQEDPAH
jgi:hypothetical protein